jgi:hypothetical protein
MSGTRCPAITEQVRHRRTPQRARGDRGVRDPPGGQAMVAFGWVAESVLGSALGRTLRLGPENEPRGVLRLDEAD